MQYRSLGGSGLKVPALSFGTGTFGGKGEQFSAWGNSDVREATRMVDVCLAAGINMFDSADVYSGGAAEEILGAARDAAGARGRFVAPHAEEQHGAAALADLLANEARLAHPPTSLFPSASSVGRILTRSMHQWKVRFGAGKTGDSTRVSLQTRWTGRVRWSGAMEGGSRRRDG